MRLFQGCPGCVRWLEGGESSVQTVIKAVDKGE